MSKKMFVVTYVDYGETCDGKARVLAVCKSLDTAKDIVKNDIEDWANIHASESIEVDFDKMCVYCCNNADDRCEWNISECNVEI